MNKNLKEFVERQEIDSIKEFVKENGEACLFENDETGKSLLYYALQNNVDRGRVLVVMQYLLNMGVDPSSVDSSFKSALDYAKEYGNMPAMALIGQAINKRMIENQ